MKDGWWKSVMVDETTASRQLNAANAVACRTHLKYHEEQLIVPRKHLGDAKCRCRSLLLHGSACCSGRCLNDGVTMFLLLEEMQSSRNQRGLSRTPSLETRPNVTAIGLLYDCCAKTGCDQSQVASTRQQDIYMEPAAFMPKLLRGRRAQSLKETTGKAVQL
jgi:hypothetical protein